MRLLILAGLLGIFSPLVKAQADCLFNFRLSLSDNKGTILNNAQVKFGERELNYSADQRAYNYSNLSSCSAKIKGLLRVSAAGFEKFEGEIEINASFSSFGLRLKRKNSAQKALFEELSVFSGVVTDANNASIENTRVILTAENGKRTELLTKEDGSFRVDIESGKYSLEFIGTAGFMPKKFERFELTKGFKNLDVVLEVKPCDDCHLIEGTPVKENNKP